MLPTTVVQEFKNLKKLGESLLTRSTKLAELVLKIENEIGDKPADSKEKTRAQRPHPQKTYMMSSTCEPPENMCLIPLWLRSITDLENAIDILEKQFELIEVLKVDVASLKSAKDKTETGVPESKTQWWKNNTDCNPNAWSLRIVSFNLSNAAFI